MPIKVTGRFATGRDTAHVLGVSRRRTNQLIEMVEQSLGHRTARARSGRAMARFSIKRKASGSSATHTARPNGSTKRAKTAKAKR